LFCDRFAVVHKIIVATLFLTMALVPTAMSEQKTKLTGRVLAVSHWPITHDPLHGGLRIQEFIFGVESKARRGDMTVVPIYIRYASYPDPDYFLPENFFDYSKKYELSLITLQAMGRNNKKENLYYSFKDVAYVKFQFRDEDGNTHTSFSIAGETLTRLEILDGVPEDILNMNMNIMLPRYELSTIKYKIIKERSHE